MDLKECIYASGDIATTYQICDSQYPMTIQLQRAHAQAFFLGQYNVLERIKAERRSC